MDELLEKVYEYTILHNMLSEEDGCVIGLSGGADSVCLLYVMNHLINQFGISKDRIVAVHINHMIRGKEADEDEQFARNLCESLGIRFVCYRKDIVAYAKQLGCTVEEAGRIYRYECFNEQCKKGGYNKIAVAHNRNDVAETVIFNMVRGSGLKGMSGIPAVRDNIIRPLLGVTRSEIEAYLEEIGQEYRTDRTNLTLDYDRNKIRHIVLPTLLELNEKAIEHICLLAEDAKESFQYVSSKACEQLELNNLIETSLEESAIILNAEEVSKKDKLIKQHILYEALTRAAGAKKDITRKHIELLMELLDKKTGKSLMMPYDVSARLSYGRLILKKVRAKNADYCIDIDSSGQYEIPEWGILYTNIQPMVENVIIPKKMYTRIADYGKIKSGVCVRNARENDYIVIDNKGSKKKLSRVFIDNKVDRQMRENWPVVACGDEIIWAIGLRYSEAFRIDDDTKETILFEYIGKGNEYVRKNRSAN